MTLSVPMPVCDLPMAERAGRPDTFPKLLLEHARLRPDRPANREKDYGIWQSWSWAEVAGEVEALACGLSAMGFRRGDKLAVIGDNRPRLYWAIAATQALAACRSRSTRIRLPRRWRSFSTTPRCVTPWPKTRSRLKALADEGAVPAPRGRDLFRPARHAALPEKLSGRLRRRASARPRLGPQPTRFLPRRNRQGAGYRYRDYSLHLGTTGRPKGVVLSFDNIIIAASSAIAFEGLTEREEVLAYLPMAWIGEHIFSYAQAYCAGFCASCPSPRSPSWPICGSSDPPISSRRRGFSKAS